MGASNPDRDIVEELASEFIDRLRRGETPDVDAYAARHPERADEIRTLFPTIALMEQAKVRRKRSSDGRVSLGAARPEQLGDYRILGEVGRGGMGVVYEAEQESLGRRVAVKVLPRQALLDPKQLERFQREARTVARLHHTNIVPVFGVGQQEGFHYYVMQLIPGVGLDAVVTFLATGAGGERRREGAPGAGEVAQALMAESMPSPGVAPDSTYWQQVARIGIQAADALHFAHSQGVLHRDVKPANLLVDVRGKVWVTDFGLAKALETGDVGASEDVVGTLRYVAPEAFGNRWDARSDVYGLGLTLYEALALRPAFHETDRARLIQRITTGDLAAPRSHQPGIPRDLETVVLKAAALEPEHRYASAAELAEDLDRFLEGRPVRARRFTAVERLWRWGRRHPAVAGLTATVAVLLVLVAAIATTAYVHTRQALEGESEQRRRAEATAVLALEALDRTFTQFAPRRASIPARMTLEGSGGDVIEVTVPPVLTKEMAAFLEEMLGYYDRLAQEGGDSAALRRATARANLRVGDIQQRLGRYDQALAAYQKAAALYRGRGLSKDAATLTEMAAVYNEIGSVHRLNRRPEEAERSHRTALELLEPAATAEGAAAEVRFELARTYYLLGRWMRPDPTDHPPGRPPPGGPHREPPPESPLVRQAIDLLTDLRRQAPEVPAYRHLLACCYRDMAHGVTSRAKDTAIQILEQLCAECPGVPEYLYDLSETYAAFDIHGPALPPGTEAVAQEQLDKALAASERLTAAYPHVPDYVISQVHIRHKLGAVLRRLGRLEEAEAHLRKAVDLQADLAKQFAVTVHRVWLALIRQSLADLLAEMDALAEARSLVETTIADLQALRRQDPEAQSLNGLLGESYLRLARLFRRLGDRKGEAEARRQAEHYRALAPRPEGPRLPPPRPLD